MRSLQSTQRILRVAFLLAVILIVNDSLAGHFIIRHTKYSGVSLAFKTIVHGSNLWAASFLGQSFKFSIALLFGLDSLCVKEEDKWPQKVRIYRMDFLW